MVATRRFAWRFRLDRTTELKDSTQWICIFAAKPRSSPVDRASYMSGTIVSIEGGSRV